MSDYDRDLARDENDLLELGGESRVLAICQDLLRATSLSASTLDENRTGVDRWVERDSGRRLGLELKCRRSDHDDLLVEFESSPGRPGWSIDPAKVSDYLLYLWPSSARLLPYRDYRRAAIANLDVWKVRYPEQEEQTTTGGRYRTRWIGVPDAVVLEAMGRLVGEPRILRRPDGQNVDGTWSQLGWFTQALYAEWGP